MSEIARTALCGIQIVGVCCTSLLDNSCFPAATRLEVNGLHLAITLKVQPWLRF